MLKNNCHALHQLLEIDQPLAANIFCHSISQQKLRYFFTMLSQLVSQISLQKNKNKGTKMLTNLRSTCAAQ